MTFPSPSAVSDPLDATTTPPAVDAPRRSARPPREPQDRRERPPLFSPADPAATPPAATTSPALDDPEDSAASSTDAASGPGRPPRSDIRSTTRQRSSIRRKLKRGIAGAVGGASLQLNRVLARDDVELFYGPWVAGEDDQHGIAEPLASLASRRAGPDAASPDVADLIDLLIAVAGYVSKSLVRRYELRRDVAEGRIAAPEVVTEPEPAAADPADAVPPV